MKRFSIIVVSALAVASAQASIFSTPVGSPVFTIDGSPVSPGYSLVESGNNYTLNISGFTFGGSDYGDVSWQFNFNSPTPYTQVKYTISGYVCSNDGNPASAEIDGNETIYDSNANVVLDPTVGAITGTPSSYNDGSPQAFSISGVFNLTSPTQIGEVVKDNFGVGLTDNSCVTITSIEQQFNPVPEPASMAVLAIGVIGALARKRRKN